MSYELTYSKDGVSYKAKAFGLASRKEMRPSCGWLLLFKNARKLSRSLVPAADVEGVGSRLGDTERTYIPVTMNLRTSSVSTFSRSSVRGDTTAAAHNCNVLTIVKYEAIAPDLSLTPRRKDHTSAQQPLLDGRRDSRPYVPTLPLSNGFSL